MNGKSVVVIGGGAVGLAAAWRMLERWPGARLALLEKEPKVGQHQTGNNSGVLHCGLAYRPGSMKAKLAVRGIRLMTEFCASRGVPHDICGKLVVATREDQIPRLHDLLDRGTRNGVGGLRLLTPAQMRDMEPHAAGVMALHVPEEGIVDYPAVCDTLAREIRERGGRVECGAGVRSMRRSGSGWTIETERGGFEADYLVTCCGLQADRAARMAGESPDVKVVPFRGDYFKLTKEREFLVRNLIYPVADPKFPFLGVHLTRMMAGGIEAGPNAVLALKREGYTRTSFDLADAADALAFAGLWRFVAKHASMCAYELRRAFSKEMFTRSVQTLVPEVREQDLVSAGAGVRAQVMRPDGSIVEDFEWIPRANALHVINAPSPAATACLAISEAIVDKIAETVQ
jgi:L-2-hydroxyglutarate oxidase